MTDETLLGWTKEPAAGSDRNARSAAAPSVRLSAFVVFYRLLADYSSARTVAAAGLTMLVGAAYAGLLYGLARLLAFDRTPQDEFFLGQVLLAAIVLYNVLARVQASVMSRLDQDAVAAFFLRLAQAVTATRFATLEGIGPSVVLEAFLTDRQSVADGLVIAVRLLRGASTVVACIALMALLQPLIGLLLASAFLLGMRRSPRPARSLEKTSKLANQAEARYRRVIDDLLHGLEGIKLNAGRRSEILSSCRRALERQGQGMLFARVRSRILLRPIVLAGYAVLALIAFVLSDVLVRHQLLAGVLIIAAIVNLEIEMARDSEDLLRHRTHLEGLMRIGQALASGGAPPAFALPANIETICFVQAERQYRLRDGFRLGPVSLTLRRGEITFIVGGNGSGKTTFIRLLAGLDDPTAGEVLLDGMAYSAPARALLFTAVFNDFHLFDEVHGLDPAASEQFAATLARLSLDRVTRLDGEKIVATQLSSGQRRRLALAVALSKPRPFVLFDEWTADQDPEFRAYFYDELLPRLRDEGRGVVAVTHDDRYFDRCDQRVVFEEGRIAALVRP
ncbi:putative ATP-binding cassette transporter [Roseiarcus fermentans]|uniref:Putative ATP-binding cassette transporter n=1 Tax=Roseiarcus fermentans TaxID=1473586 RepID=A0A366FRE6_9HYPH|nr:ATP-binding cassette domain-containing protein [Roseiarcus fermentans]RBP17254.1 putative ATP-binding cassette transporter [Roseiarcus fermentans]